MFPSIKSNSFVVIYCCCDFRYKFIAVCLTLLTSSITESSGFSPNASLASPSIAVSANETVGAEILPWTKADYPNPMAAPRLCRRKVPSQICDPDSILNAKEINQLDDIIQGIGKETECICEGRCTTATNDGKSGLVLGIALMEKMYRPDNEAGNEFAEFVRKQWNLGWCDNDILLLLSTTDRQIHMAIGTNAERILSRQSTDDIFIQSKPYFENENYYQGLQVITQSFYDVLRRPATDELPDQEPEVNYGLIIGISIAFICLIGALIGLLCFVRMRLERSEERGFDLESILATFSGKKKDVLRPVSINPENRRSDVYQLCSIEEGDGEEDTDHPLKKKLSQIRELPDDEADYDNDNVLWAKGGERLEIGRPANRRDNDNDNLKRV